MICQSQCLHEADKKLLSISLFISLILMCCGAVGYAEKDSRQARWDGSLRDMPSNLYTALIGHVFHLDLKSQFPGCNCTRYVVTEFSEERVPPWMIVDEDQGHLQGLPKEDHVGFYDFLVIGITRTIGNQEKICTSVMTKIKVHQVSNSLGVSMATLFDNKTFPIENGHPLDECRSNTKTYIATVSLLCSSCHSNMNSLSQHIQDVNSAFKIPVPLIQIIFESGGDHLYKHLRTMVIVMSSGLLTNVQNPVIISWPLGCGDNIFHFYRYRHLQRRSLVHNLFPRSTKVINWHITSGNMVPHSRQRRGLFFGSISAIEETPVLTEAPPSFLRTASFVTLTKDTVTVSSSSRGGFNTSVISQSVQNVSSLMTPVALNTSRLSLELNSSTIVFTSVAYSSVNRSRFPPSSGSLIPSQSMKTQNRSESSRLTGNTSVARTTSRMNMSALPSFSKTSSLNTTLSRSSTPVTLSHVTSVLEASSVSVPINATYSTVSIQSTIYPSPVITPSLTMDNNSSQTDFVGMSHFMTMSVLQTTPSAVSSLFLNFTQLLNTSRIVVSSSPIFNSTIPANISTEGFTKLTSSFNSTIIFVPHTTSLLIPLNISSRNVTYRSVSSLFETSLTVLLSSLPIRSIVNSSFISIISRNETTTSMRVTVNTTSPPMPITSPFLSSRSSNKTIRTSNFSSISANITTPSAAVNLTILPTMKSSYSPKYFSSEIVNISSLISFPVSVSSLGTVTNLTPTQSVSGHGTISIVKSTPITTPSVAVNLTILPTMKSSYIPTNFSSEIVNVSSLTSIPVSVSSLGTVTSLTSVPSVSGKSSIIIAKSTPVTNTTLRSTIESSHLPKFSSNQTDSASLFTTISRNISSLIVTMNPTYMSSFIRNETVPFMTSRNISMFSSFNLSRSLTSTMEFKNATTGFIANQTITLRLSSSPLVLINTSKTVMANTTLNIASTLLSTVPRSVTSVFPASPLQPSSNLTSSILTQMSTSMSIIQANYSQLETSVILPSTMNLSTKPIMVSSSQPPNATKSYVSILQPQNTTKSYVSSSQPPNITSLLVSSSQLPNITRSTYTTTGTLVVLPSSGIEMRTPSRSLVATTGLRNSSSINVTSEIIVSQSITLNSTEMSFTFSTVVNGSAIRSSPILSSSVSMNSTTILTRTSLAQSTTKISNESSIPTASATFQRSSSFMIETPTLTAPVPSFLSVNSTTTLLQTDRITVVNSTVSSARVTAGIISSIAASFGITANTSVTIIASDTSLSSAPFSINVTKMKTPSSVFSNKTQIVFVSQTSRTSVNASASTIFPNRTIFLSSPSSTSLTANISGIVGTTAVQKSSILSLNTTLEISKSNISTLKSVLATSLSTVPLTGTLSTQFLSISTYAATDSRILTSISITRNISDTISGPIVSIQTQTSSIKDTSFLPSILSSLELIISKSSLRLSTGVTESVSVSTLTSSPLFSTAAMSLIASPSLTIIPSSPHTSSELTAQTPLATVAPKPDLPPVIVNGIGYLTAVVGQLFSFQISNEVFYDAEDGPTWNLSISCQTIGGGALPKSSWLQLDNITRSLVGLPLLNDHESQPTSGFQFALVATDKAGNSVRDAFVVTVRVEEPKVSFLFTMKILRVYSDFQADSQLQVRLLSKLASFYGSQETNTIYVQSLKNGSTIVTWSNSSLPTSFCAENSLTYIRDSILTTSGDVNSKFVQVMLPDFPVVEASFGRFGVCSSSPTVSPPSIPSQRTMEDTGFVRIALPLIAVVLIIAVVIGVFIFSVRNRRKGIPSSDRPFFRPGQPVILPEELEMKELGAFPKSLPDQIPEYKMPPYFTASFIGPFEKDSDDESSEYDSVQDSPYIVPPPPYRSPAEARREAPASPPPAYRFPPMYFPTAQNMTSKV